MGNYTLLALEEIKQKYGYNPEDILVLDDSCIVEKDAINTYRVVGGSHPSSKLIGHRQSKNYEKYDEDLSNEEVASLILIENGIVKGSDEWIQVYTSVLNQLYTYRFVPIYEKNNIFEYKLTEEAFHNIKLGEIKHILRRERYWKTSSFYKNGRAIVKDIEKLIIVFRYDNTLDINLAAIPEISDVAKEALDELKNDL